MKALSYVYTVQRHSPQQASHIQIIGITNGSTYCRPYIVVVEVRFESLAVVPIPDRLKQSKFHLAQLLVGVVARGRAEEVHTDDIHSCKIKSAKQLRNSQNTAISYPYGFC